jgi:menaquinol-cytochrome c reductase iron-sulfur subunit
MSTPQEPGTHLQPEASNQTAEAAGEKAAMRSRRTFLFKVSLLLNGAVGAVLAVPILGYILGPALRKDSSYNSWVSLGSIDNFPEGETRLADYRNPVNTVSDGATAKVACWVRHIEGRAFQVFATNCAHLGCPVRWFAQSHLFLCPCHGGAYYADGSRASGPPERSLFQYQYAIASGELMILAGEMPTLANKACLENPLVQINSAKPADIGEYSAAKARSSAWPT